MHYKIFHKDKSIRNCVKTLTIDIYRVPHSSSFTKISKRPSLTNLTAKQRKSKFWSRTKVKNRLSLLFKEQATAGKTQERERERERESHDSFYRGRYRLRNTFGRPWHSHNQIYRREQSSQPAVVPLLSITEPPSRLSRAATTQTSWKRWWEPQKRKRGRHLSKKIPTPKLYWKKDLSNFQVYPNLPRITKVPKSYCIIDKRVIRKQAQNPTAADPW